jgi:hypothetical protein
MKAKMFNISIIHAVSKDIIENKTIIPHVLPKVGSTIVLHLTEKFLIKSIDRKNNDVSIYCVESPT